MSSTFISELLGLPVQCAMRLSPVLAASSDNVSAVVDKMVREDIGAVIVVTDSRPIGIITEKDIVERVVRTGKDMKNTQAKDVMSAPVVTIEFNRPLKEALELMHRRKIRRLVVTKAGSVIGLLTERRLLEVAFLTV